MRILYFFIFLFIKTKSVNDVVVVKKFNTYLKKSLILKTIYYIAVFSFIVYLNYKLYYRSDKFDIIIHKKLTMCLIAFNFIIIFNIILQHVILKKNQKTDCDNYFRRSVVARKNKFITIEVVLKNNAHSSRKIFVAIKVLEIIALLYLLAKLNGILLINSDDHMLSQNTANNSANVTSSITQVIDEQNNLSTFDNNAHDDNRALMLDSLMHDLQKKQKESIGCEDSSNRSAAMVCILHSINSFDFVKIRRVLELLAFLEKSFVANTALTIGKSNNSLIYIYQVLCAEENTLSLARYEALSANDFADNLKNSLTSSAKQDLTIFCILGLKDCKHDSNELEASIQLVRSEERCDNPKPYGFTQLYVFFESSSINTASTTRDDSDTSTFDSSINDLQQTQTESSDCEDSSNELAASIQLVELAERVEHPRQNEYNELHARIESSSTNTTPTTRDDGDKCGEGKAACVQILKTDERFDIVNQIKPVEMHAIIDGSSANESSVSHNDHSISAFTSNVR